MPVAGHVPLRRLKEETADLHLRAETHVHILDGGATVEDYRAYLGAMLGFHAPIERALAGDPALAAAGFDAPARHKRAWLAADLRALGDDPARWPACAALPDVGVPTRAVGAAYVLEGSMLGGRYILAKLPPALAALRGRATAFLDGYGAETGARWRGFGAVVERLVRTPGDTDLAVAGARDTFARLIDWLALGAAPLREAS